MKPGRNSPCPCGSGKKFKKCCGNSYAGSNLRTKPSSPGNNIADLLQSASQFAQAGQLQQASTLFNNVLRQDPNNINALHLSGVIAAQQGDHAKAKKLIQKAISIKPDVAIMHCNLGNVYKDNGNNREAIECYKKSLTLDSKQAKAHFSLGLGLSEKYEPDLAIASYKKALERDPDYVDAYYNLGVAFSRLNKYRQAIKYHEKTILLRPNHVEAHIHLANIYKDQGKLEQAIEQYDRILALAPNHAEAYMNKVFILNYSPKYIPQEIFQAHIDFTEQFARPFEKDIQAFQQSLDPARKIRIGYVSSDFKTHSVAYFIEPVFAHHDHDNFKIYAYYNRQHNDKVTNRLRGHCDYWRNIAPMSDAEIAEIIRQDKIDILIDLSGYTANNRLLVFARKPAPIQVTWIGYPATTGLSVMDYRITDKNADPEGKTESIHTEELLRLPDCFSCYQAPDIYPEVNSLPAKDTGYITFGSFNNFAKTTPDVIALWAQLLHAIPNAKLTLKSNGLDEIEQQQYIQNSFAEHEVSTERLNLLGSDVDVDAHLNRYNQIDIGLDTFPYNGTTTTCEALWMGVPVITLAGDSHRARVGSSLLNTLGLTELIADTPENYIANARNLAADVNGLSDLRSSLRERMASSPLMDASRFTLNLESTYRTIWKKWCTDELIRANNETRT